LLKILLFGEYNRFHTFLKQGLQHLEHNTIVVSREDAFKEIEVDLSLEARHFQKPILRVIRKVLIKLIHFDLADLEIYYNFLKYKKQLKGYDIVQMVNEFPLKIHPFLEKKCLNYVFKNNKAVYLASCGTDSVYITYLLNNGPEYHLLSPYLNNSNLKKYYKFSFMYLKPSRQKLHAFAFKNIKKVIPADFDYVMAYRNHKKVIGLIPHAINLSKFEYKAPILKDKIVIFHGINRINYYRKGNFYFEDALAIIKEKHDEKIEIVTVENLPYKTYIAAVDQAHILLDQVHAYDQGYNALEAMAKGKVVFTGAEKEWESHYNIQEDTVAINALPDASKIAEKLEWLIRNPEKIAEIGKNARQFVEMHHDHVQVAKQYLQVWESE